MHPWRIQSPPAALQEQLQACLDNKTKPVGSLGELERLALQIGMIQHRLDPTVNAPQAIIFAADHGIASHGVSAFPPAVTAQMVTNFVAGGAAISVLADTLGIGMTVVDVGVNASFPSDLAIHHQKIRPGSRDMLVEPALWEEEADQAIAVGHQTICGLIEATTSNTFILGEMGIGNTSAATLITALLTNTPLGEVVGNGTGLSASGVQHKLAVLESAIERRGVTDDPWQILCRFGGLEIAAMVGAALTAAQEKCLIIVDGFIATAAVAIACALEPHARHYCVFGHQSAEPGHRALLKHLDATPLLSLSLRLGEGTGAALALPLVRSAAAILTRMSSFEAAGVSRS
jgi:nicotinate-nucleotide--dimethylbenzimidazole phosphoribosyltransferase